MSNLIRFILLLIAIFGISSFLIYNTMAFGKAPDFIESSLNDPHFLELKKASLHENGIDYNVLSDSDEVLKNDIIFVGFGKLASAFLLAHDSIVPKDVISRNKNSLSVGKISGIFSLYDPFEKYEISDFSKNFSISQITNGSFYLSHEEDGSIHVYSLDSVLTLSFFSENQKMTDMMLFPGTSLRFDSKLNSQLKDANLLRILKILKDINSTKANVGIEFINPKLELGEGKVFVGLPLQDPYKRALFQSFEKMLNARIEAVDLMKDYAKNQSVSFGFHGSESAIMNPTKNMYRLLGELQVIFSRAVKNEINAQEFSHKVLSIRNKAREFGLSHEVDGLMQQFLIDGRFVLYIKDNSASQYHDLYNEAAAILGITPEKGKEKFFQSVSDIFSENLIFSEKGVLASNMRTAATIRRTINDTGIEMRDYFDLSLYAFLMFPKIAGDHVTAANIFDRTLLEEYGIYELYLSVFRATQKYAKSLSDANEIKDLEISLVNDFYEPMLRILVDSLYQVYTINENNAIVFSKGFINAGEVEFSSHNHKEILRYITDITATMRQIFDEKIHSMKHIDGLLKNELEVHLIRLEGFVQMSQNGYRQYQSSPFESEENGARLPKVNLESHALVRKKIASEEVKKENTTDPSAQKILVILNQLLGLQILPGEAQKTENGYQISTGFQGWKLTFHIQEKGYIITQVSLVGAYDIEISEIISVQQLRLVLVKLQEYDKQIKKIYQENPDIKDNKIRLSPIKKQIKIGDKSFNLN